MSTFTLPAGCRMYITASMEPNAGARHRWTVSLVDPAAGGEQRAIHGSHIAHGQSQRIDAAPVAADCLCEVVSTSETSDGWEPDIGEVTLRTPGDLAIRFRRPSAEPRPQEGSEECVLAFRFHPAIAA